MTEENIKFIFDTDKVEEIIHKKNEGYQLKRYENPWFENNDGVRKAGILFAMTDEEIEEYVRCASDIHYFAEKYAQVKTEDGEVRNITLRDYQIEILNLYNNNRFSILMASRQVGKCVDFNTIVELTNGKVRIGVLYYMIKSLSTKLTFIEKVKIQLYNFLYRLEKRKAKLAFLFFISLISKSKTSWGSYIII